ncbi:MAG TPA: EAL domain-containing protein [Candidatus Acidoferrales bacterium]|nr:EAL domain-containing protein [Candidatus Acidoferrales bacterium]
MAHSVRYGARDKSETLAKADLLAASRLVHHPRHGSVRRSHPHLAGAELRASEARYQTLAEQSTSGVLLLAGGSLDILDGNSAAAQLSGYTHEVMVTMSIAALIPEPRRAEAVAGFGACTETAPAHIPDAQLQRSDGSIVFLDVRLRRLEDGRILSVWDDISGQHQAEEHLRQLLAGIQLFAATFDADGTISYANPALSRLTGWTVEELIGRSVYQLLPPGTAGQGAADLGRRLRSATLQNPMFTEIVTRSGGRRLVAISATQLGDRPGESAQAALLGQDVTDERSLIALQGELRERSDVAAALGRLQPGGSTAETGLAICRQLRGLMAVDLAIVATFDTDGGATILSIDGPEHFMLTVGSRLPSSRASYLIERAKLGPWAERWWARPEDGEYGSAMSAAGVQGFSYAPIRFGDTTMGVLAVGALSGDSPTDPVTRLPAMTEFGSAASSLLGLELQAERLTRLRRSELESVMERHAYYPVFQPIIDTGSGEIRGFEALTRFRDGERPDVRLATAWTLGLGAALELSLLEPAIALAHRLPGGRWLALNVSPRLLDDPGPLRAVLAKSDRPLVIEITEHEVITDYRAVREALLGLGSVRTAVDDAGAGIANFAHIVELRPDFVKLDIGLVRGIDTDPVRQAMVVAMSHFAKATGCQLIAEGVETAAEAGTVKELGAHFGQGYWYGRPEPIDALRPPKPAQSSAGPAKVRNRTGVSPNPPGLAVSHSAGSHSAR